MCAPERCVLTAVVEDGVVARFLPAGRMRECVRCNLLFAVGGIIPVPDVVPCGILAAGTVAVKVCNGRHLIAAEVSVSGHCYCLGGETHDGTVAVLVRAGALVVLCGVGAVVVCCAFREPREGGVEGG